MTLDEAIEYLEEGKRIAKRKGGVKVVEAFGLGIEALKRVLLYRKGMYIGLGDKMPGEEQ